MASPGQLVKVTAEILGIPEPTVILADRFLSEAGLRSKSGRGRGAARVTADDAANLLIALSGSPYPKDAVQNVVEYAALPVDDMRDSDGRAETWTLVSLPIKRLQDLPANQSFRDTLVALLEAASEDELREAIAAVPEQDMGNGRKVPAAMFINITVAMFGPDPGALIEISGLGFRNEARYGVVHENLDDFLEWSMRHNGDQRRRISFGLKTITAIGDLLAGRAPQ